MWLAAYWAPEPRPHPDSGAPWGDPGRVSDASGSFLAGFKKNPGWAVGGVGDWAIGEGPLGLGGLILKGIGEDPLTPA